MSTEYEVCITTTGEVAETIAHQFNTTVECNTIVNEITSRSASDPQ